MLKYTSIIALFLLVGCGGSAKFIDVTVEDKLKVYLDDYLEVTKQYKGNKVNIIKIDDSLLNKNLAGYCDRHPQVGLREVRVVSQETLGVTDSVYRVLMYHEFGHCVHDLDHDDMVWIMEPVLNRNAFVVEYHWDAILNEFLDYVGDQFK